MNFQERSYSGQLFRPKPEILFKPDERLLVAATPWGNRAGARRAVETISDYFSANSSDTDATSPFKKIPQLSAVANNLRVGVLLANEYILSSENREEYKSGAEIFALAFDQKETVWLHAGQPHVLFKRVGKPLMHLSANIDLSMELSQPGRPLPPLPSALLGIDAAPNLVINSIRPNTGDKIILISRSWLPQVLFTLDDKDVTLEGLSRALSKVEAEMPYWLGVLDF